ncbi:unnamed protein product, partial [Mesorhabditis spiculigera]
MWHRTHEVLPDSEDYWVKVDEKAVMLKNTEKFIEFPCETTARTGVYRFDLIGPNNVTVTAEKTLFVNASTEVKLQLREGSIFPHCSDEYQIRWTNPRCTSSPLQFRLRLLAVPEGNPDHVEERAIYVEEIVETVHGGWSPWSAWSPCEGVCGTGVRTRSRACDSPKPKRGRACSGDVIERLTCPLKPCPEQVKRIESVEALSPNPCKLLKQFNAAFAELVVYSDNFQKAASCSRTRIARAGVR